ncbi:AsmA-like C-terminal region-containing protein, partial [Arachidicoccus sp.]|uniref:AsmA-like C-terminal region-containing protein n=1 Tax=Arachidicoccus sp. TaxID=1872624 RepID=UPI003D20F28E
KQMPIINGALSLKNGYLKTSYYPDAITAINLLVDIQDETGTLKDLKIKMNPATFTFEGKPIYVKANLENFDNIAYAIQAKGDLDVGRIYKVFSQKGLDLDGYVKADLSLKGTQKDAEDGNYSRLHNSGRLLLRNIKTTSDYFPLPFIIKEGLFTFHQEKMRFKDFKAVYGKSDFLMNGYLQNVIAFILTDKAILKGNFSFNSRYVDVDEFMTNSDSSKNKNAENSSTGVVVIPSNYNLQLQAFANRLNFQGLQLDSLHGDLSVNKGQLHLAKSGFNLIGCNVLMDLLYKSLSTQKAHFDYSINAQDFDVKKAYNQIKMFRDMASAAKNAEGIISLDYKIAGNLNKNMQPIYPSLIGGGTLAVKKVKMKGYKLFGAVSDKTKTKALDNPDLSEVKINTTIKNSVINIQQFKFKVAGFRPRIEGQTTFDGRLAIKMRLGLPPLGIIGIPLKITGTEEKPKISIGRKIDSLPQTQTKDQ